MPSVNIFHGTAIIHPGVYVYVDVEKLAVIPSAVFGKICLIGEAVDGIPQKPLIWTDLDRAIGHHRKGNLVSALNILKNPSVNPVVPPPNFIITYRVNPGTQAERNLIDANNSPVIKVKSKFYSAEGNKIKIKCVPPNDDPNKRVVGFEYGISNEKKVGEKILTIRNNDTNDHTVELTQTTVVVDSDTYNLQQNELQTIKQLKEFLETRYNFLQITIDYFNENYEIEKLNTFSQTITAGNSYSIYNTTYEVFKFFNNETGITEAELISRNEVQSTNGYVFLVGGSSSSATLSDWDKALQDISKIDVDFVIPLSTDDSVIQKVIDHTNQMNSLRTKKFREAIVGIDTVNTYTTLTSALNRIKSINNPKVRVVFQRVKRFDYDGKLKLMPEWALAVIIAGMKTAEVGIPLTFKRPSVVDVDTTLADWSDLSVQEQIILSGGLGLEPTVDGGWRIIKGITSYTASENLALQLDEAQTEIMYIQKAVDTGLEQFIGERNSALLIEKVRSALIRILNNLQAQKVIVSSISKEGNIIPAYRNIQIEQEGDTLKVSFECTLSVGVNYIFVDVFAFPPGVS